MGGLLTHTPSAPMSTPPSLRLLSGRTAEVCAVVAPTAVAPAASLAVESCRSHPATVRLWSGGACRPCSASALRLSRAAGGRLGCPGGRRLGAAPHQLLAPPFRRTGAAGEVLAGRTKNLAVPGTGHETRNCIGQVYEYSRKAAGCARSARISPVSKFATRSAPL
jgi:hypothetical protein